MHMVAGDESGEEISLNLPHKSWVFVIFAALFLGMGALSIWLLGYSALVVVKDDQLRYELKFLDLFIVEQVSVARQEVKSVSIELVEDFGRSYEVAIESKRRNFRLWLANADGDLKRRVAGQLQHALAGAGRTYHYSTNDVGLALLIGLIPLVGGLLFLAPIQRIRIVADRKRNELMIKRHLVFFPIWRRRVLPLSDVNRLEKKVSMISLPVMRGSSLSQTIITYNVIAITKSDTAAPIAIGPIFSSTDADKLIERLQPALLS